VRFKDSYFVEISPLRLRPPRQWQRQQQQAEFFHASPRKSYWRLRATWSFIFSPHTHRTHSSLCTARKLSGSERQKASSCSGLCWLALAMPTMRYDDGEASERDDIMSLEILYIFIIPCPRRKNVFCSFLSSTHSPSPSAIVPSSSHAARLCNARWRCPPHSTGRSRVAYLRPLLFLSLFSDEYRECERAQKTTSTLFTKHARLDGVLRKSRVNKHCIRLKMKLPSTRRRRRLAFFGKSPEKFDAFKNNGHL
jgi:hypothetical protein